MTDTRRGITAFVLLGLTALLLLALSGWNRFAPVQNVVGGLSTPVQEVLTPIAEGVRSAASRLTFGSRTQAELERLQGEVDRLTAENVRLRQLQYENDQLRQQLGFTSAHPELALMNARVIGLDPSSLRQYLVVNRGSADGIQPGMGVVHPGGALIGQILRTEENRSEVLLITDIESAVNAQIERTRAGGIVEGQWQKGSLLQMRYIEQGPTADGQQRVQKGDWVVTSGLGGNLPDGLLIGQVDSVEQSDTELEQKARVLPAVDVRAVENVLIVKSSQ